LNENIIERGLAESEYHANACIGASTAKLAHQSIRLYKDALKGIYKIEDKAHFQVGRLAHMAYLEPERFAAQVVSEGPINSKTGKEYGRDTNAWRDWAAENPGVIVVDPWIHLALDRCPGEIQHRLSAGESEESWFARRGNLSVKARPDKVCGNIISDLKTIDNINRAKSAIYKNGYWFSDAWYRMIGKLLGKDYCYEFIFVEKTPPHRWRTIDLSPEFSSWADRQVEDTIAKIEHAMATGDWSDSSPVYQQCEIPEWLEDAAITADEDGSINLGEE